MCIRDRVVAVGKNPAKLEIFSQDERVQMIRELVEAEGMTQVEVQAFSGLTVDFARSISATAILRGLRNVTDLNFEFQLALTNRALTDIETVFIMSGEQFAFTSSTLIKQIATGGDVNRLHRLIPPAILQQLKARKQELGGRLPWAHQDHLAE